MKQFMWLFGVILFCDVSAQKYWPQQEHQLSSPFQQQMKDPTVSSDKCDVEELEKIQCGPPDITPEQCEGINCCSNGYQCYYGKAGMSSCISTTLSTSTDLKYLNGCKTVSFVFIQ